MTMPARRRPARFAASPLLGALAGLASGCCQPGYVAVQPGCPPMASQPAAVRYGDVCQTPAGGSAVVVQSTPAGAATMGNAPRPRVVVSEPGGRLAGRTGWRRSDPESIATRLEGAIDDDTVRQ